jgi:hypothetical protein
MVNIFRDNENNPPAQALIVFCAGLIVMLATFLVSLIDKSWVSPRFYWLTAASFLLFFSVFNSVSSLISKNVLHFWARSIYSYMGLALLSGIIAWRFSGISIYDAGTYSWIYVVVTIVYVVFLTLVRSMKMIVEFAQKEEWQNPNLRRRKK